MFRRLVHGFLAAALALQTLPVAAGAQPRARAREWTAPSPSFQQAALAAAGLNAHRILADPSQCPFTSKWLRIYLRARRPAAAIGAAAIVAGVAWHLKGFESAFASLSLGALGGALGTVFAPPTSSNGEPPFRSAELNNAPAVHNAWRILHAYFSAPARAADFPSTLLQAKRIGRTYEDDCALAGVDPRPETAAAALLMPVQASLATLPPKERSGLESALACAERIHEASDLSYDASLLTEKGAASPRDVHGITNRIEMIVNSLSFHEAMLLTALKFVTLQAGERYYRGRGVGDNGTELLELFLPMSDYLGMPKVVTALGDPAFALIHPDTHRVVEEKIAEVLRMSRPKAQSFAGNVTRAIVAALERPPSDAAPIAVASSVSRVKSAFSTFIKMRLRAEGLDAPLIVDYPTFADERDLGRDLLGAQITLANPRDAWAAVARITDFFDGQIVNEDRFKRMTRAKNGYDAFQMTFRIYNRHNNRFYPFDLHLFASQKDKDVYQAGDAAHALHRIQQLYPQAERRKVRLLPIAKEYRSGDPENNYARWREQTSRFVYVFVPLRGKPAEASRAAPASRRARELNGTPHFTVEQIACVRAAGGAVTRGNAADLLYAISPQTLEDLIRRAQTGGSANASNGSAISLDHVLQDREAIDPAAIALNVHGTKLLDALRLALKTTANPRAYYLIARLAGQTSGDFEAKASEALARRLSVSAGTAYKSTPLIKKVSTATLHRLAAEMKLSEAEFIALLGSEMSGPGGPYLSVWDRLWLEAVTEGTLRLQQAHIQLADDAARRQFSDAAAKLSPRLTDSSSLVAAVGLGLVDIDRVKALMKGTPKPSAPQAQVWRYTVRLASPRDWVFIVQQALKFKLADLHCLGNPSEKMLSFDAQGSAVDLAEFERRIRPQVQIVRKSAPKAAALSVWATPESGLTPATAEALLQPLLAPNAIQWITHLIVSDALSQAVQVTAFEGALRIPAELGLPDLEAQIQSLLPQAVVEVAPIEPLGSGEPSREASDVPTLNRPVPPSFRLNVSSVKETNDSFELTIEAAENQPNILAEILNVIFKEKWSLGDWVRADIHENGSASITVPVLRRHAVGKRIVSLKDRIQRISRVFGNRPPAIGGGRLRLYLQTTAADEAIRALVAYLSQQQIDIQSIQCEAQPGEPTRFDFVVVAPETPIRARSLSLAEQLRSDLEALPYPARPNSPLLEKVEVLDKNISSAAAQWYLNLLKALRAEMRDAAGRPVPPSPVIVRRTLPKSEAQRPEATFVYEAVLSLVLACLVHGHPELIPRIYELAYPGESLPAGVLSNRDRSVLGAVQNRKSNGAPYPVHLWDSTISLLEWGVRDRIVLTMEPLHDVKEDGEKNIPLRARTEGESVRAEESWQRIKGWCTANYFGGAAKLIRTIEWMSKTGLYSDYIRTLGDIGWTDLIAAKLADRKDNLQTIFELRKPAYDEMLSGTAPAGYPFILAHEQIANTVRYFIPLLMHQPLIRNEVYVNSRADFLAAFIRVVTDPRLYGLEIIYELGEDKTAVNREMARTIRQFLRWLEDPYVVENLLPSPSASLPLDAFKKALEELANRLAGPPGKNGVSNGNTPSGRGGARPLNASA